MTYKIDFSGRAHDYTEEEIEIIVDVAKRADPLTQGSHLSEFEDSIKKYIGAEHAFPLPRLSQSI